MAEARQAVPRPVLTSVAAQLFVADIQVSCDFYTDKLGFTVDFIYGDPPFYAQVTRDNARLSFRHIDEPVFAGDVREREHLLSASITVGSADEIKLLFMSYKALGLSFHQTLKQEPWGATTFVVVGGGPTGVELAGAIAEIARDALKSEFHHIDPAASRILLVEAGPRILPTFPDRLAADAARRLSRYGVQVMTSAKVVDIDAEGVTLADGRIAAATVLWAAGVRAGSLTAGLPGEHDRAGRARVGADLSLAGHPDIFVIGDGAASASADGAPIPGIAPAAKQMGAYVGQVIARRLSGRPPPPPFRYRHAGDLATVGRGAAVVKLGGLELTGFPGWLFWGLIHVYFLIGLRARFFVALDWLWSYVTYQRGARLITGS